MVAIRKGIHQVLREIHTQTAKANNTITFLDACAPPRCSAGGLPDKASNDNILKSHVDFKKRDSEEAGWTFFEDAEPWE